MLKFEIRQYLKDTQETVLNLDEDGIIALIIKESKKYTDTKPRMTRAEAEKIFYMSFKDAIKSFKGWTTRV